MKKKWNKRKRWRKMSSSSWEYRDDMVELLLDIQGGGLSRWGSEMSARFNVVMLLTRSSGTFSFSLFLFALYIHIYIYTKCKPLSGRSCRLAPQGTCDIPRPIYPTVLYITSKAIYFFISFNYFFFVWYTSVHLADRHWLHHLIIKIYSCYKLAEKLAM